jgi:hypothetical protein
LGSGEAPMTAIRLGLNTQLRFFTVVSFDEKI